MKRGRVPAWGITRILCGWGCYIHALSTYLSIHKHTPASIHSSVHLHVSIHVPNRLCTHPFICVHIHAPIHLSICPSMHHLSVQKSTYPCTPSHVRLSIYVLIPLSVHLTDIHWQLIVSQTHLFSLTWPPSSINNWPLFPFGNFLSPQVPGKHALLVLLLPYLAPTCIKLNWLIF